MEIFRTIRERFVQYRRQQLLQQLIVDINGLHETALQSGEVTETQTNYFKSDPETLAAYDRYR